MYFVKNFRKSFLQNTSGRWLLNIEKLIQSSNRGSERNHQILEVQVLYRTSLFKKKKKRTSILKILFTTFLLIKYHQISKLHSKAATGGVLLKKVFLKTLQNS